MIYTDILIVLKNANNCMFQKDLISIFEDKNERQIRRYIKRCEKENYITSYFVANKKVISLTQHCISNVFFEDTRINKTTNEFTIKRNFLLAYAINKSEFNTIIKYNHFEKLKESFLNLPIKDTEHFLKNNIKYKNIYISINVGEDTNTVSVFVLIINPIFNTHSLKITIKAIYKILKEALYIETTKDKNVLFDVLDYKNINFIYYNIISSNKVNITELDFLVDNDLNIYENIVIDNYKI